jgi:predicted AlkP superfamily pyrophosphatase or phosphodiesterase
MRRAPHFLVPVAAILMQIWGCSSPYGHTGVCGLPALTAGKIPKALVIGIDGTRADAIQTAETPALDCLLGHSAWSFNASTQLTAPAVSAPGWVSVLTGVEPSKHWVLDNESLSGYNPEYPSFLLRARRDYGLKTAAAAQWFLLITEFLEKEGALDFQSMNFDKYMAEDMARHLKNANSDIHFIVFDDADEAGHLAGFGPDEPLYILALQETDASIGKLLDAILARPSFSDEEWLVIVTSDHGGGGRSHGTRNPDNRTIFLIVSGPGAEPGEIKRAGVSHLDVYPTVMTFFGYPPPPEWGLDGRVTGLSGK